MRFQAFAMRLRFLTLSKEQRLSSSDKSRILTLQFGRYNFVVEADIKGFLDNIDHDRLIEKWVKAGVDTAGVWQRVNSLSSASWALRLDAEASISEEPGARKPHAGICAGAAG